MPDPTQRLNAALEGRYSIERELGEGAMATVYLAHDVRHDRKVAIKVLKPELAACVGAERFVTEIKTTANLQHPHILPLFESGEADEFLFYVMPYIDGESLRERLDREHQLPVDEALGIATNVAEALDYAHQRAVIHRDIKPENILLQDGIALVADFGIAVAVSSAGGTRLTETGVSLGTPTYMSPEQIAGERDLDRRSDIYALACVTYEMLAGDPPFVASSPLALLAKHLTDPAPPVTTTRPGVSAETATALAKALSKTPADRPETAGEFAKALHAKDDSERDESPSIVVLPFANLSSDPDNEYFSDGLTDEIITDLSAVQGLRVISCSSAMMLKGSTKSLREIGDDLSCRYALEGAVRRSGDNLRITAKLVETSTDTQLWAEKYGGTIEDVFDIQEQLSRKIVEALEVTLSPREDRRIAQRPIDEVRAYECYLRARAETWRWNEASLKNALRLIQNGLDIVGDNELLYAAKGNVYVQSRAVGIDTGDANLHKAQECAKAIFSLNPDSHHGRRLSGAICHIRGDIQGEVRCYKQALSADPNNAGTVLSLTNAYLISGQLAAARPLVDKLLELDPLIPLSQCMHGWLGALEGRAESAIEPFARMHRMDPENPMALLFYTWALACNGRTHEVVDLLEGASSVIRRTVPGHVASIIYHACLQDGRGVAEMLTAEVTAAAQSSDDILPRYLGQAYAMLDERDEAVRWLRIAAEKGFINYPFWAEHDPLLEKLRGYQGFDRLLEEVKKRWQAFEP